MRLPILTAAILTLLLGGPQLFAQHGMMRGAAQQRVAIVSGGHVQITGVSMLPETFAKLVEFAIPGGGSEQREVTQMRWVYQPHTDSPPLEEVRAYTPDRKLIEPQDLKQQLAKPTVVFVCDFGEKADPAYVALLKPDTICLFLPQMGHGLGAFVPADGEVGEAAPAPGVAPAEAAPAKALPSKPAPDAALARIDSAGKLTLRRRTVTTFDETAYQTVEKDGKRAQAPLSIKSTMITEQAQELPATAIKAFDMAGKPIAAAAVAEGLASERPVLVSGDGQPVDPALLEIIKPGTLILAMPANHSDAGMAPPPEAIREAIVVPEAAPAAPAPVERPNR